MNLPSDIFFDLVIVGAGPAGCTAALILGDKGLKILLVDKSELPAAKVCGDALSGTVMSVLKRLPGNCYEDFLMIPEKTPSWGIRFVSPGGKALDLPFYHVKNGQTPPAGYICKREVFDGFLLKKIREMNSAEVLENFHIKGIKRTQSGFILKGEKGELQSRMILGADGSHSLVGKVLGGNKPDYHRYCLGTRAYFKGVKYPDTEKFLELHFLSELLPSYLWIFPMKDDLSNVGIGIMYRKMKNEKESLPVKLRRIIETHPQLSLRFRDAILTGTILSHGLPLGPQAKALSGERFLLTGDAASLIDPFSGEGIGNAMISGEIAANVIQQAFRNNDLSASFLKEYDLRLMERLGRELETSRTIQYLAGFPALFNFVVNKALKKKSVRDFLAKMYTDEKAHLELKNPLFYLRLLLRKNP